MPGMSEAANITAGLKTHLGALGVEPGSAALRPQNLERLVADVRSVGNAAVPAAGRRAVPPTPEMTMNEADAMGDVLCRMYPKLPNTVYSSGNRGARRANVIGGLQL